MKYKIGKKVYELIPESKMKVFNDYLTEKNIELEVCEDLPYTPFYPVDLKEQCEYSSLLKKDRWFELLVNNKILSKYFYKVIDDYKFNNCYNLGKLRIDVSHIFIPYVEFKYGDYIFIHNKKYNITLAGKIVDILEDLIELYFEDIYFIAHHHLNDRSDISYIKQVIDSKIINEELDFDLISPNEFERKLLEFNAYRIFDRILEI